MIQVTLKTLTSADAVPLTELANNRKIWLQLRDVFPHPYTLEDANNYLGGVQRGHFGHVLGILYQDTFAGVVSLIPQ